MPDINPDPLAVGEDVVVIFDTVLSIREQPFKIFQDGRRFECVGDQLRLIDRVSVYRNSHVDNRDSEQGQHRGHNLASPIRHPESFIESDNGNVHRAAANIIVFKSHAARGSVCNVLLSRDFV